MLTMYDANYVGIYMELLDGTYELYLVLSKRSVEDSPHYLESWVDTPEAILVPKDKLDFPPTWVRKK